LCLYDRCDDAVFQNLHVAYLTGRGLYLGATKNVANRGYTRESIFQNVRITCCGSATLPSVEITSVGDNVAGSDATDLLQFHALNIFASKAGGGLVIRNDRSGVGTNVGIRTIKFYGLRVEGVFNPVDTATFTGDLVRIGDPSYNGKIYEIEVYGFISASSYAGFSVIKFDAPAGDATLAPYNCEINGTITGGAGGGINVVRGRNLKFRFRDIATAQTNVTIGSGVGANILIDGSGGEDLWTYNIDDAVEPTIVFPNKRITTHPGIRDSTILTSYYTSQAVIPSSGAAAVAANTLYCQPFFLPQMFVDRIGIEITTGAAGAARLGIYTNNVGVPGTLISDFGTVDTTNIAIVEATIAQVLPREWFWAVAVFNATPSVRTGIGSGQVLGNNVINGAARVGVHGAFTYAALPANAPTIQNGSTAAPAIFFRKT
jgi:hypothetical protein